MPFVGQAIELEIIRHRIAEPDFRTIDVGAAEKVEVAHPLQQILQMSLIRLQDLVHNRTLAQ